MTNARLVREVVETDYSGDHSTKRTEVVEVEIKWLTDNDKEPALRNPQFAMAGDWRLLR